MSIKKTGAGDSFATGSRKKDEPHAKAQEASDSEDALISRCLHDALTHHQAGRLPQAEDLYREILEIEPAHPDALHLLGVMAHQVGQNEIAVELIGKAIDVKPSGPMYYNLGIALQALGKLEAAAESYRSALSFKPDYAEAHYNLGNALRALGKLEAAADSFHQALLLKPDYVEAHSNFGLALHEQDKFDAAVDSYRRALSLKPDFADTHYKLGNVLQAQGKLDATVDSYRRALSLKPDHVEAHNNLGVAFHAQGKLDAAVESYHQALSLKPDYAEAHGNLGLVLQEQGKLDAAVDCYYTALAFKPNYVEAFNGLASVSLAEGDVLKALEIGKQSFQLKESNETKALIVECIKNVYFIQDDAEARDIVARAFSESWGRPGQLVTVSTSLINSNLDVRECIVRAVNAWPLRLGQHELFGESGLAAAAEDKLLQCLLEHAPINTLNLERFLTMVRFAMLGAAAGDAVPDAPEEKVLTFYCAIARQCFINEFVFSYTDEEFELASALRTQLAEALASGTPVPALWPVVVAAYFPLFSLPAAEILLSQTWPDSVAALLVQQVREPLEEQQYRTDMPGLTAVEQEVSRLVRQQYEENPYPRWVKSEPPGKPTTIDIFLRKQFAMAPFQPLGKSDAIDILIAGCGTGQHSIETAQQFRSARVLAIDLSLTSLSYAKRKTRELGLRNIEYAQADIMELGTIGRSFDLIESVGVLHHLADPVAGWRQLLSLLRPGGFMRLGLYSECARQNVVAARRFIAEHGYVSNAVDIRRCRQELVSMDDGMQFRQLTTLSDFYATSECRDLLFHVQEHRFTLLQIKEILGELGLDFIGFSLEPHVVKKYRERFPEDKSKIDLSCWNVFEAENPNTFVGMYQFFVQKRV